MGRSSPKYCRFSERELDSEPPSCSSRADVPYEWPYTCCREGGGKWREGGGGGNSGPKHQKRRATYTLQGEGDEKQPRRRAVRVAVHVLRGGGHENKSGAKLVKNGIEKEYWTIRRKRLRLVAETINIC